ncbi:polyadenylate-binding protein 1-like, partial [Tachysurus ichikawai]
KMNSVTSKMASLNVMDLRPNVTESPSAVPAPARKPLTIYMLESADLDEQIRMLRESHSHIETYTQIHLYTTPS